MYPRSRWSRSRPWRRRCRSCWLPGRAAARSCGAPTASQARRRTSWSAASSTRGCSTAAKLASSFRCSYVPGRRGTKFPQLSDAGRMVVRRERSPTFAIGYRRPDREEARMIVKEGWRSRFFEDFGMGDVYEHPLGRTVTTTDNLWFTLLTQNSAPVHFDHHYAAQTEFGRPLVNSTFTVALVTGQSVTDVSQNVFANLGWDEVRLPAPVFEGDTIYSRSEVLEKRDSRSRPNVGDRKSTR